MQVGPARAECGFRLGHLALNDLPLAEHRAGITRGLHPGQREQIVNGRTGDAEGRACQERDGHP